MTNESEPRLRDLLLGSTARTILASLPEETAPVTRPKSRRGMPNASLIDYKRVGPFYRQTGTRNIVGNTIPLMQEYYEHRFLHATKGWRVYHGGKAFRLPIAAPQGFQLSRRSTWRPNVKERALGLVPRFATEEPDGLRLGKPVEMFQYRNQRGARRNGFRSVAVA